MNREYEGVVIKSINYKESDKILHIFTRESGKLACIARGVRKINKKTETNVDLFSHSRYNLYKGRGFYHVRQSERLNSFFELREDLEKLSYASYILEIVDLALMEEEENQVAFDLLVKTLEVLSKPEADSKKLLLSFQLKFMSFIGYRPEVKKCISCSEGDIGLLGGFSISNGGVLCKQCQGINRRDYIESLSASGFLLLKKFLYSKLEDVSCIEASLADIKRVERLIHLYMCDHLGRTHFKSLEMLRALSLI